MRINQVLFALAVLAFGIAFAQPVDGTPTPDIAAWFASTAALAGVVAAAVALLRKHVLKTLDGVGVILASIVVGALLGLIGQLMGYVEGGAFAGIAFGAAAGLMASGGVDALRAVISSKR